MYSDMDNDELDKIFKASGFGAVNEKLADNLVNIVEWQKILKNVDIDNVESMLNTLGEDAYLIKNKDETINSDSNNILSNAPEKYENFFLVPKVIKQ